MNIEKEKLIKNSKKLLLLKEMNSNKLLIESFKRFKPTCKRITLSAVIIIISTLVLNFYLFKNVKVMLFVTELAQQLNIVLIPVFAVIITGYAIFQGLVNGNTLLLLTGIDHEENGSKKTDKNHEENSSKFEVYNLYFFGLACKYLIVIILNNIILVLFRSLPEDFSFSLVSNDLNVACSSFLISIYLSIVLNLLLNMKNFIYNLFQVFITNATVNVIDSLKNNEAESINDK